MVMFVLLLYHFGKVSLAVLTLSSAILCIFGAFVGLYVFGLENVREGVELIVDSLFLIHHS